MREITAACVADYLRDAGRVTEDERVLATEMPGGVSNMVIRCRIAAPDGGQREFVVKQARPRLRVEREWLCSVERNWRELDVLRACQQILDAPAAPAAASRNDTPVARTPRVLWEDRENYLFAMSAAPAESRTWKEVLLAGDAEPRIARACGALLARLHAGSWGDAALAAQLADRSLFDALRLDPYYRAVAAAHADLGGEMARLIESVAENCSSLVHADFSPKNLLVHGAAGDARENAARGARLTMIDFETGHYGDGAFDIGFFLTHLTLKAFYLAPRQEPLLALADEFWRVYQKAMAAAVGEAAARGLEARGMRHLAACSLARLDGKSPVDYLQDEAKRTRVRTWCRAVLADNVSQWADARQAAVAAMAD